MRPSADIIAVAAMRERIIAAMNAAIQKGVYSLDKNAVVPSPPGSLPTRANQAWAKHLEAVARAVK